MEDRFSQDNISHNNLRDSHSNNRNKNVNGGGSVSNINGKNEIIPERRRKYLGGGSDDNQFTTANTSVGQPIMADDHEDTKVHKKNK
jgi:hypothetical protein